MGFGFNPQITIDSGSDVQPSNLVGAHHQRVTLKMSNYIKVDMETFPNIILGMKGKASCALHWTLMSQLLIKKHYHHLTPKNG